MSRAKPKRPAKKAAKRSIAEHVEQRRRRLLGADAVIICAQRALDSLRDPPDEIRVGDALQVASDLINESVTALDSVNLNRNRQE